MPWTKYIPKTTRDGKPHAPYPKQLAFLKLDVLEAFYGGAGAGGKSEALLMAALQYVDVPGYAAIIFRRTTTDLSLPGAVMDRAKEWLAPFVNSGEVAWNEQKKTFTFPSGAKLAFAYLESEEDKRRYASAEFQFIAYDELSQFKESQYLFLFSRLRKTTGVDAPLRMRSASNPGGVGTEWVRRRFVDPATRHPGVAFVPATIEDNPSVDAAEYRLSLANLDPVERARIEKGDWDSAPGGRFRKEWFRPFQVRAGGTYGRGEYHLDGGRVVPVAECWNFTTVDPAASAEDTAKTTDPDYTVVATFAVTPRNELLWLDCDRFRAETPDIVPRVLNAFDLYDPRFVAIEAVAANRAVYQEARRTRMTVKELSPGGKDKLVRATPLMVLAGDGRFFVPEVAHWKEDAVAEFVRFTGAGDSGHDDVVDACAWAAACLREYGGGETALPFTVGSRAW